MADAKTEGGVGVSQFRYVYGVADCRQGPPSDLGLGVEGAPVEVVQAGHLGVLSSAIDREAAIPGRSEALAHERVLKRAMRQRTVLPVAFGSITGDSLTAFLQSIESRALTLCDQLAGKVEVGLKIFWLPQALRQELVSEGALPAEDSPQPAMAVEQAVADRVEQWRRTHAREAVDSLRPLAVDYRENPVISVQMLLNAAFLVNAGQLLAIEARVDALDRHYADRLYLKLTTGLPPCSFVDLRLAL